MARITVDLNDEWLEAAREVLGTDTKVATINAALHAFALRRQAVDLMSALDSVEIDVDYSHEGWRSHGWTGSLHLRRGRPRRSRRLMAGPVYLADTSVFVL